MGIDPPLVVGRWCLICCPLLVRSSPRLAAITQILHSSFPPAFFAVTLLAHSLRSKLLLNVLICEALACVLLNGGVALIGWSIKKIIPMTHDHFRHSKARMQGWLPLSSSSAAFKVRMKKPGITAIDGRVEDFGDCLPQ